MLDLLKDCCNCFLLSLVKNHLSVLETYQVYYTILFIAFELYFNNLVVEKVKTLKHVGIKLEKDKFAIVNKGETNLLLLIKKLGC